MEGLLSSYRMLDLTDEKGFLCGKIFADLGADVIKVEPPGGDPSRHLAPFAFDVPDVNKSLYWFAYNTSKRGITLNLEHPQGREIFNRLVKTADFVLESFQPGRMSQLGLDYDSLSKINPQIILTSISPFGQRGPYRDYQGPDLVAMAMSGTMSLIGSKDKPPLRLCLDQTYCTAGTLATFATLLANHWRQLSGEGQQVDFSMVEALLCINRHEPGMWEFEKRVSERGRARMKPGDPLPRIFYACKDGFIFWSIGRSRPPNMTLCQWVSEQSEAEILKEVDWEKLDLKKLSPEAIKALEEAVAEVFAKYTKKQLEEINTRMRAQMVPVYTIEDVVKSEHLANRDFWVELEHPELGASFCYPTHLFISSAAKIQPRFRAPLVGEHNRDIYEKELGLSKEEMKGLETAGVI